jgi:hypothetical protein
MAFSATHTLSMPLTYSFANKLSLLYESTILCQHLPLVSMIAHLSQIYNSYSLLPIN